MDHDSPTAGKENASALPAGKPGYAEGDTHDLMPLYYKHLFPAESMMKWLAYGNDSKRPTADPGFMQRREFCFTLEGDIFARYQSFKDAKDLRTALRQKVPTKIDLGPVFNVDPTKRAAYSGATSGGTVFAPVERELVMDIDMTDYDDVRTCCSAANICGKCWPLMTVAKGDRRGLKGGLWVQTPAVGVLRQARDPRLGVRQTRGGCPTKRRPPWRSTSPCTKAPTPAGSPSACRSLSRCTPR